MKSPSGLVSFAITLFLVGCGGIAGCGPPKKDEEQSEIGPDQFIEQFIEVYACSKVPKCESKAGLSGAFVEPLCHPEARAGSIGFNFDVSDDRVEYDGKAARQCLNAIRETSACELFTARNKLLEGGSGPCKDVVRGTQEPGESCAEHLHCEGRADCNLGDDKCGGTCVAPVGEGEDCSEAPCEQGFRCDGGTCTPVAEEGDACSEDEECAGDLVCGGDGTCSPLPDGAGDSCSDPLENSQCPGALTCVEGTCQEGAASGESCGGTVECAPGNRCVEGTCTEVVRPGESCNSTATCVTSHYCKDGTCQPRPVVGQDCSDVPDFYANNPDSNFCFTGACQSGTCEYRSDGETCTASANLAGDVCEASVCTASAGGEAECRLQGRGESCESAADCEGELECREDASGSNICLPAC